LPIWQAVYIGSGHAATEGSTGSRPQRFHWLIVSMLRWLNRSCINNLRHWELVRFCFWADGPCRELWGCLGAAGNAVADLVDGEESLSAEPNIIGRPVALWYGILTAVPWQVKMPWSCRAWKPSLGIPVQTAMCLGHNKCMVQSGT